MKILTRALLASPLLALADSNAGVSISSNTFSGNTGISFTSEMGEGGSAHSHAPGFMEGAKMAIDAHVKEYIIPGDGMIGGVEMDNPFHSYAYQRGDDVISGTYGVKPSTEVPYSDEDVVVSRFYSSTKAMTHTVAMMLWEEDKLYLDDPISKYIPELDGIEWKVIRNTIMQPVPEDAEVLTVDMETNDLTKGYGLGNQSYYLETAHREPILRDFMTHTSGLTYGGLLYGASTRLPPFMQYAVFDALTSPQDFFGGLSINELIPAEGSTLTGTLLPILQKGLLIRQPGKTFDYGLDSDVVGYVVERVYNGNVMPGSAGYKRLQDIMQEKLWGPLKMHDTAFYVHPTENRYHSMKSRFATQAGPKEGGGWTLAMGNAGPEDFDERYSKTIRESGGGGAISSAQDYLKFLNLLRNQGVAADGTRLMRRWTTRVALQSRHRRDTAEDAFGNISDFGFAPDIGWTLIGAYSDGTYIFDDARGLPLPDLSTPYPSGSINENHQPGSSPTSVAWGGACGTYWSVDLEDDLAISGQACTRPSMTIERIVDRLVHDYLE